MKNIAGIWNYEGVYFDDPSTCQLWGQQCFDKLWKCVGRSASNSKEIGFQHEKVMWRRSLYIQNTHTFFLRLIIRSSKMNLFSLMAMLLLSMALQPFGSVTSGKSCWWIWWWGLCLAKSIESIFNTTFHSTLSYVLTNKADLNIESHGPIETPCPITIEEFLVDGQTSYHVGACANAKDFVVSVSPPVITFPI